MRPIVLSLMAGFQAPRSGWFWALNDSAPFNLRNVQVRKVWDDHYRVNVLVNVGAGTVRVANSYFVVIDGDGCLTTANPTIMKMY